MTKEQAFFLSVLSNSLSGLKQDKPDSLDWKQICVYAKNHSVQGFVFKQCKDFLGDSEHSEVFHELQTAYYVTLTNYHRKQNVYYEIEKAFQEKHLSFVMVKGLEVARFYPVPCLRTMGDLDIVLSTEDRLLAHDILIQMGFQNPVHEDAEWGYHKDGIEIELHDQLEYQLLAEHRDYINHYQLHLQTVDGRTVLSPDFHLIYLILHLQKHLMSFGVGFRQFMDLAVLAKANHETINWQVFSQQLQQIHLFDFARTCFSLCEKWFGFPSPLEAIEISPEFYELATETIFANGVFGFQNSENLNVEINHLAQYQLKDTNNTRSLSLNKLRDFLFPAYRTMILSEHYAFLRGRKWLLPFAWVYRLYRGITLKKMKHVGMTVEEMKVAAESEDEINQRSEWLQKWGI